MPAYCSPSTNIHTELNELRYAIAEISLNSNYIIKAGDLNIDLVTNNTITAAYSDILSDSREVYHETSMMFP